ncbi:class B sortase [Anaerostipes sp. Marseille-Q3525]|uniref:class B sortase n=1 Tax=Anaerostipes sp. Marseille-Q3525 TaxID=2758418 RepID=UPI001BABA7F8|nr:class B sortase [Anaerostipes sp. Marseille-Q3525]MBR9959990.1 class B sortase [Anaerostipes sp. Marseille-Q3525]
MKRMINNILLIICIFIFCISTWKLYGYYRSYKKAKDTYSKIAKENVKISKNKRKIDFKKLKSQNQDIAGWIYIRGTTIDYPIVQGKDNEEYLHQDFNKKKSSSGTVFLDNNCKKDFTSDNNIIYGHHMKNGTMFAQLLKFREKSFLKKHNEIMIFTPDRTIHLKVISAYAQKAQNKIPVTFANDKQKKAYIKKIESMSEQTIKTSRINDSHIYTFVTCSYEGEDNRTYVHAAEE